MSSAESEALIELFYVTQGPRWKNNSGWGTDAPIAEWYGVTVNEQGRVDGLSLSNNNLEGTLPSSIGNLTCLTHLRVQGNHISGGIPNTLGNLTNLTFLNVSDNRLSGSLPSSLRNLTNLTSLDVSENQLSDGIPETLGELSNLQELSLSRNKFLGVIPESFGSLSNLVYLWLNRNELLGGIPKTLGMLLNLQLLCLHDNKLSGRIPETLGNLLNLQQLYLNGNQLSGGIADTLGHLSNLKELWLNHNKLSGVIPETVGNLSNLQLLELSRNKLSGRIPETLGNLSNLRQLWLHSNQLSGPVPETLGRLSNLETLMLNNQGGIPELEQPRLDNNHLSGPLAAVLERNRFSATLFRSPAWRKAALEQSVLSRRVPPPKIKVNLCGNVKAGKTQIVQGWLVPTNSAQFVKNILYHAFGMHVDVAAPVVQEEERTIGMDIHSLQVNGCELAVWDYGGQQEFSMLHHHYLGNKHAVYLLVSSLVDGNLQLKDPTRLATELTYWWRLIVSVGKEGCGEAFAAPMAIVLTHLDQVDPVLFNLSTFGAEVIDAATSMGVSWPSGEAPRLFAVNARNAAESKAILPWLCEQHRLLQALSDPVPETKDSRRRILDKRLKQLLQFRTVCPNFVVHETIRLDIRIAYSAFPVTSNSSYKHLGVRGQKRIASNDPWVQKPKQFGIVAIGGVET